MNDTIITIVCFIIRFIFYFYMTTKYERKIIIPLVLYGIFEITYATII